MSTALHLACLTYIRTHPDWTMEATTWPIGADWDDMIAAQRAIYREARTKDASIERLLADYDKHHNFHFPLLALSIAIPLVIVTIILVVRWLL